MAGPPWRRRDEGPGFWAGLAFTCALAAFLIVPALVSMTAGVTENYFRGVASGLTLRWVGEVLDLYLDTIWLSLGIALATLACTLVIGVPPPGTSCATPRA